MKSRPALPGRPAWVRSWRSLESDRSWQWHPGGQFHGKSDPEQNAVPSSLFHGDFDLPQF
jgi:hypothetical protein